MNPRRERMISAHLQGRDIADPHVLAAFAAVPREAFVDPAQQELAYEDMPLPIGYGQTISQPYVVAIMAQALELTGTERLLEIGTGSGYAAAIFGRLAQEVHTVERIEELARDAADRLARLGIGNVHVHHADGTLGWPPGAPYDAIAVAAGAPAAPPSLLHQLTVGGRIVLPIGTDDDQRLTKITRQAPSEFVTTDLGDVRFVRLIGAEGWHLPRATER